MTVSTSEWPEADLYREIERLKAAFHELERRFEQKIACHRADAMRSDVESQRRVEFIRETSSKECLAILREVAKIEEPVQRAPQDNACEHCANCQLPLPVDECRCVCPATSDLFIPSYALRGLSRAVPCARIRALDEFADCPHWQPKEPAHA